MGTGIHKVVSKSVLGVLAWGLSVYKKIMGQTAGDIHNPAVLVRWGPACLCFPDSEDISGMINSAPGWSSSHLF